MIIDAENREKYKVFDEGHLQVRSFIRYNTETKEITIPLHKSLIALLSNEQLSTVVDNNLTDVFTSSYATDLDGNII